MSATPEQIAERLDAQATGLLTTYGAIAGASVKDLRAAASLIRAQSERERVLVEALEQVAQWDISGPPLTKNDANIPPEDFPHYVAGRAHAELALIRNYARNSIARAALKAAP